MNRKGHGRKRSWRSLRRHPGICIKGLKKTIKLVGGTAGIRNLQNIKQKFYRLGYDDRFSAVEMKAV